MKMSEKFKIEEEVKIFHRRSLSYVEERPPKRRLPPKLWGGAKILDFAAIGNKKRFSEWTHLLEAESCGLLDSLFYAADRPDFSGQANFTAKADVLSYGDVLQGTEQSGCNGEVHCRVHDFYAAGQIQEDVFGANNPEGMNHNKLGEIP